MSETTYEELFDEYIKERLREGGDPDYMVDIAKIYRNENSSVREYAFREWVREGDFTCDKCGKRFEKPAEDPNRFTNVLCARCQKDCNRG